MSSDFSVGSPEAAVPPSISCATGFVHNVVKEKEGFFSFELWSEVVESMDAEGNISIFEDTDKFYMVDKIFILPEVFLEGNVELHLEENKFVSVVYRTFFFGERGEFVEALMKIEDPNPAHEEFMVNHLSKTEKNRYTPERFWLNRIIRFFCFGKRFFE